MNSLSAKPFESKTFFLDLSSYPHSAKLSKDLAQLGAKEVFAIPQASFVVSDRASIKSDCNSPTPFSGPRSNSPLFRDSTLDYVNSPAVHSPSFEPKYLGERVKPISRGLSILMKSNEKTQGVSHKKDAIVDLCKRWNVRIYPLQKVLKFIDKYKMKHLKVRSSKKKYESEDLSKILPPYIKIEDAKREFRPKYKTLTSPKIVDSILFKCAKNLVKNTKQSTNVKEFVRPVLQEISVMTQISRNEPWKTEPASITKPPGASSISNSMSVRIPSTVVKEERKNRVHPNKTKKEKKKAKKDYCEICRIHYTDGETHFEKELHKKFLENSENFAELEKLISTLPSVEDFIAKLQKEEEPIKEVATDMIELFESPNSIEDCSNKGSGDCPKQNDEYVCITERYSLKENEIISSSCSCPSTPLPFLQERETVKDEKSFSAYKKLRNELSSTTNRGILNKSSKIIGYNSHMADSGLYENNLSHISETLHSNFVYLPNKDANYGSPVNLSCDNQTGIMCPVQRISGDYFAYEAKEITDLECPSKTLLTIGESLNDCESLCLPSNYYVSSVTPLDLSHNPGNINAVDILENSVDVIDNIAHSNLYSAVDVTEIYASSNINCVTDGINISAVGLTTPAEAKNANDACSDNPEPVPSLINFVNVDDQVSGTNCKLDNADCDTEIYSSESDVEDLNKIVASCIEEVDKDLENNSPAISNCLNNNHKIFCFDTVNFNSPNDSIIDNPVTAVVSGISSVEQLGNTVMEFSFGCKSTESSNVNDFSKHPTETTSPPAKRIRLQSETFSVLNNKSFEKSNEHDQELASPISVESANDVSFQENNSAECKSIESSNINDFAKHLAENKSSSAEQMQLQSQIFSVPDKSFEQSHEQELTVPISVASANDVCFQEINFAECKSMESSNINDSAKHLAEATSPPAKKMRFQSEFFSMLNNKSFEKSNEHEQELTLSVSVESANDVWFQEINSADCESVESSSINDFTKHLVEAMSHSAERMQLQSQTFSAPNNRPFEQSNEQEQELSLPISVESANDVCFQKINSVECKSVEPSNIDDFAKHLAVNTSPPAKRMRLQSQNSFVQSNVHEQKLISLPSVESAYHIECFQERNSTDCKPVESKNVNDFCKYSVEGMISSPKTMRIQLQNSLMFDELNNKSFVQCTVHEQEITSVSAESLSESTCLQNTNSVVKEEHVTLPFQDESSQSYKLKMIANSTEAENSVKLSLSENQSVSLQLEKELSENELGAKEPMTCSVTLDNSNKPNYINESSSDVKLCEPGKVNVLCENTSNNIDVYSEFIDFGQPPVLEPIICFASNIVENSCEPDLSNIDDSSMPPILEPEGSFSSEIIDNSEKLHIYLKETDSDKPLVLESSIINLPFKSEKNSDKVTFVSDLGNVNTQFQVENFTEDSPSENLKDTQKQYLNANNDIMLQSFKNEPHFTFEDDDSNNHPVHISQNSISERICCELNSDFMNDTEKLKRISKAIQESNISSEEFNCHDVFIILDETKDVSDTVAESSDFQNLKSIKLESSCEQLSQVINGNAKDEMEQTLHSNKTVENNFCSFNDTAIKTGIIYEVVNDQMDVYNPSEEKYDNKLTGKELKQFNKDINEDVKACLNAIVYDVEITVMKTCVIDNADDEQMDYISTVNYDLEEKSNDEISKEVVKHVDIAIHKDVNACVSDIINDIEITSERKKFSDNTFECIKREHKRKSLENKCINETADIVNEKKSGDSHSSDMEWSDYTKYKNICDKEIKIIIPKLTIAETKRQNICDKEIKIIIPKLTVAQIQQNICDKEIRIIIPKLNVAESLFSSSCGKKDNISHIGLSNAQNVMTTISSDTDGITNSDQASGTNEFKTNEDDSSDIYSTYNSKVGDLISETHPLQAQYCRPDSNTSEEINSSMNKSLNISEEINYSVNESVNTLEEINSSVNESINISDEINSSVNESINILEEINSSVNESINILEEINSSVNESINISEEINSSVNESINTSEEINSVNESINTSEEINSVNESINTSEEINSVNESINTSEEINSVNESINTSEEINSVIESVNTSEEINSSVNGSVNTSEEINSSVNGSVNTSEEINSSVNGSVNTSEEINSLNESLNTSGDIDSRTSNESINYAYDFSSVEYNYVNPDSSDNVQNRTVHIVHLNSPQPLTGSCA